MMIADEKLFKPILTEEEKRELRATTSTLSQVLSYIKLAGIDSLITRYEADKWTKKFTAKAHLNTLVFCQLAGVESLRMMEDGMEALQGERTRIDVWGMPSRSTLSYANNHRNWQFFEGAFYSLLNAAHTQIKHPAGGQLKRKFKFNANLYSVDSTTIDLCHSLYDWADFRRTKGGVKLHMMLEHDTFLPVWAHITEAKHHDKMILETVDPVLGLKRGSFLCVDRAYNDYAMLNLWNDRGVNFVCRAKDNMAYKVVEERQVPNRVGRPSSPGKEEPARTHVVSDQIIKLTGKKAIEDYPGLLRLVTVWVEEEKGSNRTSRKMSFFTNNFKLSPVTIGEVYRSRWNIEALFKLIKQNLKIKSFLGTSANAVKIQLYSALITLVILKLMQAMCLTEWCVARLLNVIRLTLLKHIDIMRHLNMARPNSPPKPGARLPQRKRPVVRNTLF
jgi:hypothetical protein